ncbi:MAG: patatin-like phospholipase family protein, partial [Betaproteobacteria bacterium]|nr:patatin-like phospholipase family protein [Betaproteobacteria bacterium]
ITLQMVTTNVTHGRPYSLPFDDPDARLFFRDDELRDYLPQEVVDWMVAKQAKYEPRGESDPAALPPGLFQVPAPEDFPVVFAARLSLSFPLLISAVPLWAIDYEAPRPERVFRRCWFSDGGISSNFPVHLFDALLPLWPTFGVKLEGFPKGYLSRIYIPHSNTEGRGDFWHRFDDETGFRRLTGFFDAIIESMMNWNDNTLSRIPGYRDRIVRIRLNKDEGGMNLDMPKPRIDELSKLGVAAAEEIVNRFVNELPTARGHISMGWENHRWVRLRSLIAILEETIPSLQTALEKQRPGDPGHKGQLVEGTARNKDHYPFPDDIQLKKAVEALKEISDLARVVAPQPHTSHTAPQPLPVLRVRPRL